MMGGIVREEFKRGPLSMLAALVALPVLNRFKQRVDHRRYNGASLLGLRGLVIKSHGSADTFAFATAIERACDAVSHDVASHIVAAMRASTAAAETRDTSADEQVASLF